MNGTGLGNEKTLYFKVFGLYPDCGNWTPPIAFGRIDFGNSEVIW